ncbi:MAG: SMC-Scp complex subunit ScpB [Mycoplasma sp.]|nr:SMC-Scp complex subunit ScpB [Mycoplasma sp.]
MMNKEIEALLFITGKKGLNSKEFSSLKGIKRQEARDTLEQFLKEWNEQEHGISVVNFNDTFKFITNSEHKDIIADLVTIEKKQKLSSSAIETIGIIAYKQPITKAQINNIRGVASDAVVATLLTKQLIEEAGKLDTPGKPTLYKISNKFFDYFNIKSIKDLPKISEFEDQEETREFELFSSQRQD